MSFAEFYDWMFRELGIVPPPTLTPDSALDDAGLDSVDVFEVVLAIEERNGYPVPEASLADLRTLGDCYRLIGHAGAPDGHVPGSEAEVRP